MDDCERSRIVHIYANHAIQWPCVYEYVYVHTRTHARAHADTPFFFLFFFFSQVHVSQLQRRRSVFFFVCLCVEYRHTWSFMKSPPLFFFLSATGLHLSTASKTNARKSDTYSICRRDKNRYKYYVTKLGGVVRAPCTYTINLHIHRYIHKPWR